MQYAVQQKWRLKYNQKDYKAILDGDSPFFKAIVYTEIEGYKDFKKADALWKQMIDKDNGGSCPAAVYLNYLYLLDGELNQQEQLNKEHLEYVKHQFKWIKNMIESEMLKYWTQRERDDFVWYVVQSKKREGEDYISELYAYKHQFQISLSADDFSDIDKEQDKNNSGILLKDERKQDIAQLLQNFWAQNLDGKAEAYYGARNIEVDAPLKIPGKTILVEAVLYICDALQNYGPKLVYIDKCEDCEKNDVQDKPEENKTVKYRVYEDDVTILFREIFNHAFGKSLELSVHDQQKRASTGAVFGGHLSSAELDSVFYYEGMVHEILEAFVLTDTFDKGSFMEHMSKIIGNNARNEPLSFMLVYGNADRSGEAWRNYRIYLQEEAFKDFEGCEIAGMELLPVEDAPYYINDFKRNYTGIETIRQKITFEDGRKQEILHIFVDILKKAGMDIRKAGKQGRRSRHRSTDSR